MSDTIFALATPAGRGALAVVRMSGTEAEAALRALNPRRPPPRRAALRTLIDPVSRETLDAALVLWMPGPHSFTGEDVVELHLHGGAAIVDSVAAALSGLGLRPAHPGEFTRRAFENGRLDLLEAEAIADLVDAETVSQRRQALDHMAGRASTTVASWRSQLLGVLGLLEAAIDFPDEDLPPEVAAAARGRLDALANELRRAQADSRGPLVREGYRVALIGAPNAGKSSLLNALIGRDAAIVTPIPGTTRDIVEQPLRLGPDTVLLADTAGLRRAVDPVEAEGVARARAWAGDAALRLWVVDQSGPAQAAEVGDLIRPSDIVVLNKADRPPGPARDEAMAVADGQGMAHISAVAVAAEGVGALRTALEEKVARDLRGSEPPTLTRERHRRAVAEALAHIDRALSQSTAVAELMSEDVRLAARALESLVGQVGAEAVLGEVFSTFCIGK